MNVQLFLLALVCLVASVHPSSIRRGTSNTRKLKGLRMDRPILTGNARFGAAVMKELGQDVNTANIELQSNFATAVASRHCYFDKGMSCPCNGKCIVDDRSCTANRDYFDHVYANDNESSSADMDSGKISVENVLQNRPSREGRRLSKSELRMKKKKLMMMSTWIEELLPDPYQGQDLVFNYLVNTLKFTSRGVVALLYALHKQRGVHFPKPRYYIH
jgi:hypothetical protein